MTSHTRSSRLPPPAAGPWTAALLLALLLPAQAAAQLDLPLRPARSPWKSVEIRADLLNVFHFRNDSDFDRTAPEYNEDGQTVGALATIFIPSVGWNIVDNLSLYYEVEIGINYWSKHNPDMPIGFLGDVFVVRQREIWGRGLFLDEQLGFKVGYARFLDPSRLMVNHWIGVAQLWWSWAEGNSAGVFAGQVPDQTYEGIFIKDNNFTHDIWVAGAYAQLRLTDGLSLVAGVTNLTDNHVPHQPLWVLAPSARLEGQWGPLLTHLTAAGQFGEHGGVGLGGEGQIIASWAAEAKAVLHLGPVRLGANLLFLSPDDAQEGNRWSHAFIGSGKNSSATLMLTEDEFRDWYDNIDERMSRFSGGFFVNRAGLFVGDVKATWLLSEVFQPALIVGAATVLKPENALDGVLVGVEANLVAEFIIGDYLRAVLAASLLVPGKAGAATINGIDRENTDLIGMAEAALLIRY